jgi:CRISPR-associated protein Csh1
MIKTIYQFGTYLKEIEEMQPYFEVSAAPYPENATDEQVIIAEIKNQKFSKLTIERYSTAYNGKYLFRELASSRSTSIVPTLHFYFVPKESDLDTSITKFLDKLQRSIDSNKTIYKKQFDPELLIEGVAKEIKAFVTKNLSEKKNYLFTLRVDNKFLGEIPDIKRILEDSSYDKYFKDGKGQLYQGENKVCAVTYQEVEEVWGRVDTLGFTVNDIAFSRNGFNATDSYKMFPVSPQVVQVLEGTKRALMKNLSYSFSGIQYFLLPHFVVQNDVKMIQRLVERFVYYATGYDEPGFDSMSQSIINTEKVFKSILQDPELGHNSVYYDIFFFEQKQAQFAIKLHVSDVLPSRFRIIRETKNRVTEYYKPITSKVFKTGPWHFTPNFYNIKDYFSLKKERETVIEPYFFKIVEAIFYKNKLNEQQVLTAFSQKIISAFKNIENERYLFEDHVKRTFCIHQFFQQLQLFGNMETNQVESIGLTAMNFIDQHPSFFKSRLQKAAFILGCAVEVLLNSQRANLGKNEPFAKRLNNLSIDFKEMQRIKSELLNKAKQYQEAKKLKNTRYFHELLVQFDLLMMGGDDPDITKTEVSYAFSVGLVLEKEFNNERWRNRPDTSEEPETETEPESK